MHAKIHIRRSQAWRGRSRICGRGRRMRRSQNITSSCKKSARLWKRILRHTMISQSREMSFRISESTFLFYRDGWHHNDPFFLPSENCGDKMPKTRTIYKCTEKSWRRLNANSTWPSIRLVTRLFLTKHPTLFIGHFSWSQRNHSNGGQIPNQRRVWATHWIVWMSGGVCHCCWGNSGRKVRILIAIILCDNNNTSPLHPSLFHVVVDTDATATKIIDAFNKEGIPGRVTFVPLNRVKVSAAHLPDTPDARPMINELEYHAMFKPVFEQVCNNIFLPSRFYKFHIGIWQDSDL